MTSTLQKPTGIEVPTIRLDDQGNAILDSGYLGINVTNPNDPIDAQDTIAGGFAMSVQNLSSDPAAWSGYRVYNDLNQIGWLWAGSSGYSVTDRQGRLMLQSGGDAVGLEILTSSGDIKFTPNTNSIFTSGLVGIGTEAMSSYSVRAQNLVIDDADAGITLKSGATNFSSIYFADSDAGDARFAGSIDYDHTNDKLRFGSNTNVGTEGSSMVLDSVGNLGVGATDPEDKIHLKSTAPHIRMEDQNLTNCIHRILSNNATLRIQADENALGGSLTFAVGNIEHGRFDANGNFLVSTTDANPANNTTSGSEGISLNSGGQILQASFQTLPAALNLMGQEGEILQIRNDGSSIGFLSAYSNTFTFEDGSGNGFAFRNDTGGDDVIINSNGHMLIGTASTTIVDSGAAGETGTNIFAGGQIVSTYSNNPAFQANRIDSDGEIIRVRRDGVSLGSLGSDTIDTTQYFTIEALNNQSIVLGNQQGHPVYNYNPSTTATSRIIEGKSDVTSVFQTHFVVENSGDVLNTNNSYGALSDEKLKQDIYLADSEWSDVKALADKTSKFRLKSQVEADSAAGEHIGWIAQDVQEISPGLVNESVDDAGNTILTLKHSVLYSKAVKALGEAQHRIETLEAENANLKATVDDLVTRVQSLESK